MIELRRAEKSDIPKIVSLLKLSLGESLMPKSEAYWRWKHINNPFGISPVLLAMRENEIVGVRAFMRWDWAKNTKIVHAVRAVDTATDPDHQGKGVFKKLTLKLVDECIKDSIDLVFNTPNEQSKPGYLKMGWEEVDNLPIKLTLKEPFSILKKKIFSIKSPKYNDLDSSNYNVENVLANWSSALNKKHEHYHTNYSIAYLKWRYVQIPVIKYHGYGDKKCFVIFRLKETPIGIELRICDSFGENLKLEKLILELYHSISFDYLSIDGFSSIGLPGLLKKKISIGPNVTIRKINMQEISPFRHFNKWQPSIGDLEVF